jgi:hypothetical protein
VAWVVTAGARTEPAVTAGTVVTAAWSAGPGVRVATVKVRDLTVTAGTVVMAAWSAAPEVFPVVPQGRVVTAVTAASSEARPSSAALRARAA